MWHNSRVTDLIMRAFAIGLGYPEDYFTDAMSPLHSDNRTAMVRMQLQHLRRVSVSGNIYCSRQLKHVAAAAANPAVLHFAGMASSPKACNVLLVWPCGSEAAACVLELCCLLVGSALHSLACGARCYAAAVLHCSPTMM